MKRRNFLRSIIAAVVASPIISRLIEVTDHAAPKFKEAESTVEMVQIGKHLWQNTITGTVSFDALFNFATIEHAASLSDEWGPLPA